MNNIDISYGNELYYYIMKQIHKNIDEYNLSLKDYYNKLIKYKYYQNMFLFIIYKDNKLYTIFNDGDNRKKIIINIVEKIIIKLKKQNNIRNLFIPFYVSDTHFYHDNEMPFFVEAKPKNKKGILYPDQNYYNICIENKILDYDQFKDLLKKNDCNNYNIKEPIIYFSGANTGKNKHNIRMKLKEIVNDNNNNTYDIHISEKYVPMYNFCKYKYLLNLPGHQPWSYRMTKILLMNSLVIDINVIQKYIIEENGTSYEDINEKWIQFFSEYFIKDKDYIEIKYNWTDGITSDLEVKKIYNKINKIYKYYEKNKNKYKMICNNATKKANILNIEIFNKTFEYIILYFNKKIYDYNSNSEFNNFLDKMILLDKI